MENGRTARKIPTWDAVLQLLLPANQSPICRCPRGCRCDGGGQGPLASSRGTRPLTAAPGNRGTDHQGLTKQIQGK